MGNGLAEKKVFDVIKFEQLVTEARHWRQKTGWGWKSREKNNFSICQSIEVKFENYLENWSNRI